MSKYDEILNSAKNEGIPPFPFSGDQIRNILNDVDKTVSAPKATNSLLRNGAFKMGIAGIFVSALVSLLLLFNSSDQKQAVSHVSNSAEKNIAINQNNKDIKSSPVRPSENHSAFSANKAHSSTSAGQNKKNTLAKTAGQDKTQITVDLPVVEYTKVLKQNDSSPDSTGSASSANRILSLLSKPDEPKMSIPILVLNDEELKKINIFKTDSGYSIASESFYGDNYGKQYPDLLEKMGYPGNGIYHELVTLDTSYPVTSLRLLKYEGWSMEKSTGIYPVEMVLLYKRTSHMGREFNGFGYPPVLDSNVLKYYDEELAPINEFLFKTISTQPYQPDKPFGPKTFIDLEQDKFPLAKNFLPLFLNIGNSEKYCHAIIWYPKTQAFVNLLPDRYRDSLRDNIIPDNLVRDEIISNGKPLPDYENYNKPKIPVDKNIAGVEKLVLSESELARLGIHFNNNKIVVPFEALLDSNTMSAGSRKLFLDSIQKYNYPPAYPLLLKTVNYVDTFRIQQGIVKYDGWDINSWSRTKPVAISMIISFYMEFYRDTTNGKEYSKKKNKNDGITGQAIYLEESYSLKKPGNKTLLTIYNAEYSRHSPLLTSVKDYENIVVLDTNNLYKPKIDRLIPVHIDLGNKKEFDPLQKNSAGIDIWFLVNPEFIELLPDRYKSHLLRELEIVKDIDEGKLTPEEACTALKGETSYFDLCRQGGQNIRDVVLMPNPVSGNNFRAGFVLLNSSEIKIDLHDFSGNFLGSLLDNRKLASGLNQISLSLPPDISNGIYLVSITDDKGEQVVQKLIVKK